MTLETIAPYLAAVPLLLHGLAHLSGVFAPWTKSMQGFANSAWLFSRSVTLTSAAGKAFCLV